MEQDRYMCVYTTRDGDLACVFIWHCGEERGMVGSRYYVEHPLRPLETMVCLFNIDMIGRSRPAGVTPGEGAASEPSGSGCKLRFQSSRRSWERGAPRG